MNICVITDNKYIFENFQRILSNKNVLGEFDFYYSSFNQDFVKEFKDCDNFMPIHLKNENTDFFEKYDLFISLHCKQLFPVELVENYRCINVHPGLNPYNRGWFPQVFSILNKKPIGVTIHEMDKELDHGPIIFQEEVELFSYDTSFDIYQRIQEKEVEMLEKYLEVLVSGDYETTMPICEGNINYKADFDNLCEINLDDKGRFGDFIDLLRATTFAKYDNAYFYDENKNKIYISINLKKCD